MKILAITPLTFNKVSNNENNKNHISNLSFKGDSFEKNNSSDLRAIMKSLNKRKEAIFNSIEKDESIYAKQIRINDCEQLTKEYKIINEALSTSSNNNNIDDANAILNFLKVMDNMDSNRGFKRIGGYKNIKNKLTNEFVLKTMMMAKTSIGADVQNAILLYGTTNNGKITFAHALAEQSQSNIFPPLALVTLKEDEILTQLQEYAQKSKQIYDASGKDKTRSIIIIDEADAILEEGTNISNEIFELAKDCAQKYKCTLFLTTNHPNLIDNKFLSDKITPVKIGVAPPTKIDCYDIITNKLNSAKKPIDKDIDKLVTAFFANPEKIYSNGNIVDVLEKTLMQKFNPKTNDYIETLSKTRPNIAPKQVARFEKMEELFK